MQESNFNVIIDSENYTTVIGESAKIDVGQAISNVQSGKAEIEAAVQDGKAAFNLNATAKTGEFNQNATDKTSAFDSNATAKTGDFNTNATDKTTAFDNNYTAKLGAFNDNAATKQAEVDASADLAKQYAIGDPSEPTGNSAKYWAEQAASSVTGLGARVTAIEGKIPADASSSNQLADKSWVGNQGYITGITSGDVTTALGYTPYDASNPNGYTSNVGTVTSVNNTSPDGNGNVTITIPDPLPSQSGQSGKYLTTDGTDVSWSAVDSLPSQTGQSGKFLTTDGTDASWESPDLSGKADVDMSNVTTSGKSLISGLPMPSTRNIDLTLGASGTEYTAPANGWVYLSKDAGAANQYLHLGCRFVAVQSRSVASGNRVTVYIPVAKGATFEITYNVSGNVGVFKFIYAEGEPNV